ncbi:MAG TPA: hypothetical protein VGP44_05615 [Gemmatimonadales bacterium]|nr:hypothetical protein [Gemmatimonadales bacterium]
MPPLEIEVKDLGTGDAGTSIGGGELPKYKALKQAIDGFHADLLRPLTELRERLFTLLPIPNTKAASPFRYTAVSRRVVEEAISIFLTELAGPDRSREGFGGGGMESDTPDGVIQQREVLAYSVGLARGAELVGRGISLNAGRQSPAVREMLDNAFTRLSVKGALRLEGIRDEVHSILVSATDAGLSPIATARILGNRFDQMQGYEWQRIARTESAFAAEAASRNQMREYGVRFVRWVYDVGACQICLAYKDQLIPIEDVESQPPGHVSCLCSTVPA